MKVLMWSLRKLGDSNPRYGNPYVSLANWWFQPLTQTSFLLLSNSTLFANAVQRYRFFSFSPNVFLSFFRAKATFSLGMPVA